MDEMRFEAKCKVMELCDSLDESEKYCNGCVFLKVKPPFKGATSADINVWRDNYKVSCEQYTMAWTSSKKDKIPRLIECIVTDGKSTN